MPRKRKSSFASIHEFAESIVNALTEMDMRGELAVDERGKIVRVQNRWYRGPSPRPRRKRHNI